MIAKLLPKVATLHINGKRIGRAIIPLQLVLLPFCALGAMAQQANPAMKGDGRTGQMPKMAESPLKIVAIPYQSGNRRDPFLNPLLLAKKESPVDEEISRGTPPPGIAGTYIAQAALQGIALRENGRVAIVRGADTRAYFLREGDRLFDGYLKTIESDSITLIRETKMRSGKTLTQDVIKRLRTP